MKHEEQEERVGKNAEEQDGQAAIERAGDQPPLDRRRFLTTGAALAAGGAIYSVPQVAKARHRGGISPSLAEQWVDTLTYTSAVALAGNSLATTMLADVPGMDQTHRDALEDLAVKTLEMSDAAVSARADFQQWPPSDQDQSVLDLGPIIEAGNDAIEAVNEGIKEIDDQLPGIPAGGIVDGTGDAMERVADSLEDAADSMDNKLPGSGTVVRVLEGAVRIATVPIRILGTLCD